MPNSFRPTRSLLIACGMVLLAACKAGTPGAQLTTGAAQSQVSQGAAPAANGAPANVAATDAVSVSKDNAPAATPNAAAHAGLVGLVDIAGVPLANADVKVFALGNAAPIATGKTLADGSFLLDLGDKVQGGVSVKMVATGEGKTLVAVGPAGIIAAGGGNIIAAGGGNIIAAGGGNVISPNGGTIVAAGGGNVISPNGGTIVAAGGGNIVAAGGGNLLSSEAVGLISHNGPALLAQGGSGIVAAGGGNIVAAGGGNIVAAGGGNLHLLAVGSGLVYRLTPETTSAISVLEKRFEALGGAAVTAKGTAIDSGVVTLISAYGELAVATQVALKQNPSLGTNVTATFDGLGTARLDSLLATRLAAQPEVATAFKDAATRLATAIADVVAKGGVPPDPKNLVAITLAGLTADAVTGLPIPGTSPAPASASGGGSSGDAGGGSGGVVSQPAPNPSITPSGSSSTSPTPTTSPTSTPAPTPTPLPTATPSGTLIYTFAGTGVAGSLGDNGPANVAQLNQPAGLVVDAQGNTYIADQSNNRIRKITPSGTISTIAGTGTVGSSGDSGLATSAQLNGPSGVALDTAGNLYIADQGNNKVRKVTTGGMISTVAGTGVAGSSGDNGQATLAQFHSPSVVVVDSSNNFYIADRDNQKIRRVSAAGVVSTFAGNGQLGSAGDGGPATSAFLGFPQGLALDIAGNLLVSDWLNHKIRKVTPGGVISTVAGTGAAGFSGDGGPATGATFNLPLGITIDAAGNLYVADANNHRIRRIDAASGNISTIAGNGTPGALGDVGVATSGQLNSPSGVARDAGGNLYISDQNNNKIRRVF